MQTAQCQTPICLACNMGPCPNRAESSLIAALRSIERASKSKGLTDAERKTLLRDIAEMARAAIADQA